MSETDLPEFEGVIPIGTTTNVTGTGQRITRAIHHEERVLLLVEAEADNIAHVKTSKGWQRVHRLKVIDLYELDDSEGKDLLRKKRAEYRAADDEKHGRQSFAFDDTVQPAQYVEQGGVILTAQEIAEQRGESYDPAGDLLTVEFSDGSRALWPDDWSGSGQSLASVGGFMRPPDAEPGETLQVVALIDVDSGEPVAEWSDEDEEARLLAAEHAAEREEAADDAAAVEELEAGRASQWEGTPWDGYGSAGARDLVKTIAHVEDLAQLQHAQHYEASHANRPSVVKALDARVEALVPHVDTGEDD